MKVGYHGTIMENVREGLDINSELYDKSRVSKARYPGQLDIIPLEVSAASYAYETSSRAASENQPVLLWGVKIDKTRMLVQRILRLHGNTFLEFCELKAARMGGLELVVDDVTDQFMSQQAL